MKLIGTAKDLRFTHPLRQTDSHLDSLAQAVVAQQNDAVHKDTRHKGTLRRAIQHEELVSDHDVSMRGSDDGTGTPSSSIASSASPTPPPLQDGQSPYDYGDREDGRDRRAPHSP